MKSAAKVQFGDFQTPLALARRVCARLQARHTVPATIVEPTCGQGAFLIAAAEAFPQAELRGFEINPDHLDTAHKQLASTNTRQLVRLVRADFFSHDWDAELRSVDNPLILGNPPWVTNAAVAAVAGTNLPLKENVYGLRGLAAKTGKANFDIAEWMLVRLLKVLRGRRATLAVLCKFATARKVLRHAWRHDLRVASAALYQIDAPAEFGAAVEACLLFAQLGGNGPAEAEIFPSLESAQPARRMGLAGPDLVADLDAYRELQRFEGLCPYQWRSGVKHDCADVLELTATTDGFFANKLGDKVALETGSVFPCCKGTDIARHDGRPSRWLLLPQTRLGENTDALLASAPCARAYLERHRKRFGARKSSIYARGGTFAIFGIGDYTFAPWKVAVSSLHRPARFALIGPVDERPVVFDDTCYYISFTERAEAEVVVQILNSAASRRFLDALMFTDAKRAFTVELLQRLNVAEIAIATGYQRAWLDARRASGGQQTELALGCSA
jgi:hypothetical protein